MIPAETERVPTPRGAKRAARAERWLLGGCTALTLGIVLSLTPWAELGAQLTLGGFLAAVIGLHMLGRSGPVADT